jgi:hypothetical protein
MSHDNLCHPRQPIYLDDERVARFKPNAIVQHLFKSGQSDMKQIENQDFSDEDRRQFAQITGYSVSDYGLLPYGAKDENLYLSDNDAATLRAQIRR